MGVEEEDGFILFEVFGAAKSSGRRLIGGRVDLGVVIFSGYTYTFSVSRNNARFLCFGGHGVHGATNELLPSPNWTTPYPPWPSHKRDYVNFLLRIVGRFLSIS